MSLECLFGLGADMVPFIASAWGLGDAAAPIGRCGRSPNRRSVVSVEACSLRFWKVKDDQRAAMNIRRHVALRALSNRRAGSLRAACQIVHPFREQERLPTGLSSSEEEAQWLSGFRSCRRGRAMST
jgi:hypothetical protein